MKIGKLVSQSQGYKAFIPEPFPPNEKFVLSEQTEKLHAQALLQLGKLDGITQLLPDLDFFIFMYVRKEAALSSQIEGTRATMIDLLRSEAKIDLDLPDDVDDIRQYIEAMNYGFARLQEIPISQRLIKEVHGTLMDGGRTSQYALPGEFRKEQNWIGGATPQTARFVPPPVSEMLKAMSDLEKFLNSNAMLPLVRTALAHAQFETIHPFVDGNGRTGRLLITFHLCQQKILERPVLYISAYFKKHRETYFDLLHGYHSQGKIEPWLNFFFEGVSLVANEAIETSRKVTALKERDFAKVHTLGKGAKAATTLLQNLYKLPIVNVRQVEEWTGLTRANANNLVERLIKLKILEQQNRKKEYARVFHYSDYLKLFTASL